MAHCVIFGFGYSAGHFAARALTKGWTVTATIRGHDRITRTTVAGLTLVDFAAAAAGKVRLPDADIILSTVPPGDGGDPVINHFSNWITSRPRSWVGYLSTTGVYGDHGGDWVDEDSPCRPSGERQQRRLAAEQKWCALSAHSFRLAGIYGPGRSAFDQITKGEARFIRKPGHCFGRIHVEDIVGILFASLAKPDPGAIYNCADDEPAPSLDVLTYATRLMKKAPPEPVDFDVVKQDLSPMALSFWRDNKRVCNRKIKDQLGYQFCFPTYREGLEGILPGYQSSPSNKIVER